MRCGFRLALYVAALHAGAMFDVENTVNRWVKTEHRRHREGKPNPSTEPTRYLQGGHVPLQLP
jgi:hypothetical protein